MEPFALTAEALREPWRLWTCHLAHFGWEHALANAMALAVPVLLASRQDRSRLALIALLVAPLLSLALLPDLALGQYRGASGLACALWAWVGLRLVFRGKAPAGGRLLLGGLLLKLSAEAILGVGLLVHPEGWQALPTAHLWGSLLGLTFALPVPLRFRHA